MNERDIDMQAVVAAIGVTGHRVLADLQKIESGVDEAIRRVQELFPSRRLQVISALAEGADRLVAYRVLQRPGSCLIVPLPMPTAEYIMDFRTPESRSDFLGLLARAKEIVELPIADSREDAYEAVGYYVLDHSDVLIAVWDGQGSQGRGGTGAIVAAARRRNLPVAWIHAGNREPGTLEPTSLGKEQGTVTFENL
jgi:hypothetical protein